MPEFVVSIKVPEFVVNINEMVSVRLTEDGIKTLQDYWHGHNQRAPLADSTGWHQFQLWNLMAVFGKEMWIGNPKTPFIDNELRFGR